MIALHVCTKHLWIRLRKYSNSSIYMFKFFPVDSIISGSPPLSIWLKFHSDLAQSEWLKCLHKESLFRLRHQSEYMQITYSWCLVDLTLNQPNYTWIILLLRSSSHLYVVLHISNSDIIRNSRCFSQSSRALLWGPTYHCVIVCLTFAFTSCCSL